MCELRAEDKKLKRRRVKGGRRERKERGKKGRGGREESKLQKSE